MDQRDVTQDDALPMPDDVVVGVSDSLFHDLIAALDAEDGDRVQALLQPLHAADIADIIENTSENHRHQLIEIIRLNLNPDILVAMDENVRENVLDQLGTQDVVAAVSDLESDDAISIISDLEEDKQEEVLRNISAKDRAILEQVLSYPEDSAGRLMQHEVVVVPATWTVGQAVDFIHQGEDIPQNFYDIFVVDNENHPLGKVSVCDVVRHSRDWKLVDLLEADMRSIPVTMDQKEVVVIFRHYGLVSAPVVDEAGAIVGMITLDDVVDIIDETAEKDILHLSGVGEADLRDPVFSISTMRLRWLLLTLVNSLFASFIVGQFQASIESKVSLAVLMSIVAAMGGSAGMQVVTVTIRALATRELRYTNMAMTIKKEIAVALINGLFLGAAFGTIAYFWFGEVPLAIVLAAAVAFNILWAALVGVFLPIVLHRMDLDPAISAAPFLATTTDILGYASFLGLASLFLF